MQPEGVVANGQGQEQVHLRLEGQLRGPWVDELRRVCDEAAGVNGRTSALVLDLADVSFVDPDGVALLCALAGRQVVLTHCSTFVAEQLKGGGPW